MTPPRPLTVQALVDRGRLERIAVDLEAAWRQVDDAEDLIADLPNLTRDKTRHDTAYEAAFHAVLAHLAADGVRLKSGPGHHAALASYARAVFVEPAVIAAAAAGFDRMRKDRARSWYDAALVTAQQAQWAAQQAGHLLTHVRDSLPRRPRS